MGDAATLRSLAYDFGLKRIGAAFGQDLGGLTRELPPLAARGGIPDWEEVAEQVRQWRPALLLIGLPLHIDGRESALSERARRFARQLWERFQLPCEMVDERLSSAAAQQQLPGRRGAARAVDSTAARLVLEGWLHAHTLQRTGMEDRLRTVRARIAAAAAERGVPAEQVRLVGAGKGQPAGTLYNAQRLGLCDFGENYLGEALRKTGVLGQRPHRLHFLGVVQSNKTAAIAAHFDWVHGVARPKSAERLSAQREPGKPPLQVCLQFNASGETQKAGVKTRAELRALAEQVAALPRLQLRGLMALPHPETEPERQYRACRQAADAFFELQRDFPQLDTLSLGSSADFESAIRAGANLVRIGSVLFGARADARLPA